MLNFKPDLEIKDLFGHTAMDLAVEAGEEGVIIMLQNFTTNNEYIPQNMKKFLNSDLSEYAERALFERVQKMKSSQ